MTHWRITAWTLMAGLTAILILGRLPALERATEEVRAKTAMSAPRQMLSDDNLADAMVGLRLKEKLTRVGWDHSILTVDLTLRSDEGDAQPLWRDLTQLIRFCFGETGNVRQVLIRVHRQTGGGRTLLVYGDSRKPDWAKEELAALQPGDSLPRERLTQRFRLVTTSAGERWLRNLSN